MKYPQLVSMPSAVSEWLEEQLEARGIDAVVYTRYVLSLLHRDTSDLVCSDQDFQVAKEVRQRQRQSGRGRKRFRRSTEWWSHVRADVEQLRRSAAVECLMSAAEQKCGIESLVDELCEKLKHIESSSTSNVSIAPEDKTREHEVSLSPTDLARRYYAAFPPLSKSASANLITLIANNNLHKRHRPRKPRVSTDAEMKSRSGGKRFTYLRNKRDFGFARSMEKSAERTDLSDWDMYLVNQNRAGDEGYSTSDTNCLDETEDISDLQNNKSIDDSHLAKLVAKFDRRIEALWNTDDHIEQNHKNEYHDLPVDIQELLATPTKTVEILNVANKCADKPKAFIQCGTNIISSIWTDCSDNEKSLYDSNSYCNLYNEALDDQFNSLSVAADKIEAENETNLLFENFSKENNNLGFYKQNDFTSLPWELAFPPTNFNNKKWSDAENFTYGEVPFVKRTNSRVNDSLLTLNHNKESCFREVIPKQVYGLPSLAVCTQNDVKSESKQEAQEDEDLLTSTRTHFRPIKQDSVEMSNTSGQYADGTTFAIRSSLEHVNYRRSDSGTLYLESGFDSPKKYMEYRDGNDKDFVLKFCVKQNEKFCQTEEESKSESPQEVPVKKRVLSDPDEFFFPGDEKLVENVDACECNSRGREKLATNLEALFNASSESCSIHGNRTDSTVLKVDWTWRKFDQCNNNWSNWPKSETWGDSQSLQQIWSSSEELSNCRSCPFLPGGSGSWTDSIFEYF